MKATLLYCVLAANAFAATPVLVRVTPETLVSLQAKDPMIRLIKPAATDEVKVSRPVNQSIIKDSTILHDGRNWTLVPNGAVVFLPEALKSRVNAKPVGNLLQWSDFLTRNRAWISTNEVTFDQAAGSEEIPAANAESWAKQGKLVIAVHQRGPISVRVSQATASNLKQQ